MSITGIVCGLGNPGPKYSSTRHNIGFMVIDRLIDTVCSVPDDRIRIIAESSDRVLWEWTRLFSPQTWLLIKPLTFMNKSGGPLKKVYDKAFIDPDKLLVVHDEVDFPLGKIRIKSGGGLAGHNGLRSIAERLGTRDFIRLRIGVGRPESSPDLASYVLNSFLPGESKTRDMVIDRAVRAIRVFRDNGLEKARQEIAVMSQSDISSTS